MMDSGIMKATGMEKTARFAMTTAGIATRTTIAITIETTITDR
jgi:hypothetical protein